jgi:CubicO group peptidase (beta-lactamase class C family)
MRQQRLFVPSTDQIFVPPAGGLRLSLCQRTHPSSYGSGMSPVTPHIIFSVSKSICGTLGGILADRGLIDPDDQVIDYIPELASSVYAGCTIRHLLDMGVGIAFTEGG